MEVANGGGGATIEDVMLYSIDAIEVVKYIARMQNLNERVRLFCIFIENNYLNGTAHDFRREVCEYLVIHNTIPSSFIPAQLRPH